MRSHVSLLVLLAAAGSARAASWQQFLDEDGVKGYARSVPGSDILEVRSTMVIPAQIEVVGAVLRDVEGLARPGSSCTEARLVERPDRNHYTFYLAYDFTWPVANRDVVIQVENRYDLERGRVLATLRAVRHPRVPPRKGFVRITELRAQFVVEYLDRQRTGVVYTSRTDPGGRIPTFLVNRANKSNLRSSALDLRRATQKPEYRRAAAASPDAELVRRVTGDPGRMARIVKNRLREFIGDRALVERLVADAGVLAALTRGSGEVGAVLLHGWGSAERQRQAIRVLLRRLLASHTRDRAAVERFVAEQGRLERIRQGRGGDEEVRRFLAGLAGKGQTR